MKLGAELQNELPNIEVVLGAAVVREIQHGIRNGSAFHVVLDVKEGVISAPRIVWAEQR